MVKYSTAILLIAVAVVWSSASARPHHESEQNHVSIDEAANELLKEVEDEPEPFKTKFTKIVEEARHKQWNSDDDFFKGILDAVYEIYVDTSDEETRRKRSDEFSSEEALEFLENTNDNQYYQLAYLAILVKLSPSHESDLLEKFTELYLKEIEDLDNFENEADHIFEEVTGENIEKYADVIEYALKKIYEESE